jgi:hypothetical protein
MRSNLRVHLLSTLRNIRSTERTTIDALGRISTSSGVPAGIHLAATESLRAVHTQATLPFLASFLDSPDERIRHQGLAGLSMFIENLPVQAADLMPNNGWLKPQGTARYRTPETDHYSAKFGEREGKQDEYVSFWKAWWATMKTRIGVEANQVGTTTH